MLQKNFYPSSFIGGGEGPNIYETVIVLLFCVQFPTG